MATSLFLEEKELRYNLIVNLSDVNMYHCNQGKKLYNNTFKLNPNPSSNPNTDPVPNPLPFVKWNRFHCGISSYPNLILTLIHSL